MNGYVGLLENIASAKIDSWPYYDTSWVCTVWQAKVPNRPKPEKDVDKTRLTDADDKWTYTVTQTMPADTWAYSTAGEQKDDKYSSMTDFTISDVVDSPMEIIGGAGGVKVKIGKQ